MRIDKRFHIPNGSMGPGSYSAGTKGSGVPERASSSSHGVLGRINTEEEVYDDEPSADQSSVTLAKKEERDLEAASDA